MADLPEQRAEKREGSAKQKLEIVAASIGAVLAAGTLGVIVWDGLRDEGRPALISLRVESVHQHDGGFVVEILASNNGDATAAGLLVEGSLTRGEQIVETSEATFDYVPSRSERHGGLNFGLNPALYTLRLQAKGYAEP